MPLCKCVLQRRKSQFQIRQIMSAPQHIINYLGKKVKDERIHALKRHLNSVIT